MGCCCSEPVSEMTESIPIYKKAPRRSRTKSFYVSESDVLSEYEAQVKYASQSAYMEDLTMDLLNDDTKSAHSFKIK